MDVYNLNLDIFYEINSDSIAKYAKEIVYKGDGHIRIRDAHFYSLLREIKSIVDTVLVGFGCSELFGETIFNDLSTITSKNYLINHIFNNMKKDIISILWTNPIKLLIEKKNGGDKGL